MKRPLMTLMTVVAVALVTAVAAWADKPDKSPAPGFAGSFPAGVVCPFALSVEPIVDGASATTHYDKQGDIRWIHGSGPLVYRYTNDDTGTSVDLNISGPGKQTEGADGLIHIDGTGPWSLAFFPGDSPSSTFLYLKGHLHFTVDPTDGTLTLVSHTGTVENICDMLD
jgi:hypothetical protein